MKGVKKPEHQWCELYPGQKVKLTGAAGEQYHGVVDERTDDGAFVWVLTIGSGRKLIHVDDGYDATSDSQ